MGKKPTTFLWPIADLSGGDNQQSDCGKIILPFTLLQDYIVL